MAATVFRSHRQAASPGPAVSGIYGQLCEEWARLADSTAVSRTMQRWGRTEPALKGYSNFGELLDAIDEAAPRQTDEILAALIRVFHRGQQLAGRAVLQALLPKLSRLAKSRAGSDNLDLAAEDRRCNVIATFWQVLAKPGAGRAHDIAGQLALDTLHQLTAGSRRKDQQDDLVVEPVWFERHSEAARTDTALWGPDIAERVIASLAPDEQSRLPELLSWGLRGNTISRAEAAAIAAVHYSGPRKSAQVAAELGVSAATLRQRCSRGTRALVAAVRADAEHARALELAS